MASEQDTFDLQAINNLFATAAKPKAPGVESLATPEFQSYTNAILAALQPEFQRQRQGLSDQFRMAGSGTRAGGAFPTELAKQSGNQTTLASEAVLRNAIPYLESQRVAQESALSRELAANQSVLNRGSQARPQVAPIAANRDPLTASDAFRSLLPELFRSLIGGTATTIGTDLLRPNSTLKSLYDLIFGAGATGGGNTTVGGMGGAGDFDNPGFDSGIDFGDPFQSGGDNFLPGDEWDFSGGWDSGDWSW